MLLSRHAVVDPPSNTPPSASPMQVPRAMTRTPAAFATQSFGYVVPSHAQTGSSTVSQAMGRDTHDPGVPQPTPAQNSAESHAELSVHSPGPASGPGHMPWYAARVEAAAARHGFT
jgi:hypothetical protein